MRKVCEKRTMDEVRWGDAESILNTKRLMGPSQLPATQQKCYLLFNWKVFYFGMLGSCPDIFYICAHSLQTGILRLSPIFNLAKRKTIFDAWTTATQTFPFKKKNWCKSILYSLSYHLRWEMSIDWTPCHFTNQKVCSISLTYIFDVCLTTRGE